jgi:hypothetical protein
MKTYDIIRQQEQQLKIGSRVRITSGDLFSDRVMSKDPITGTIVDIDENEQENNPYFIALDKVLQTISTGEWKLATFSRSDFICL